MSPRRLVVHLRRVVLTVCLVALGYLWIRFDVYPLPDAGCSPVARFGPGDTLLLDLRPRAAEVGDALLVRGDDGLLHLVVVTRVRPGEVWVGTDAPSCPGPGSEEFGWVASGDVAARALMALPW